MATDGVSVAAQRTVMLGVFDARRYTENKFVRGVINFCVKSEATHPAEIARASASQHSSTALSLRTRRRKLCEHNEETVEEKGVREGGA